MRYEFGRDVEMSREGKSIRCPRAKPGSHSVDKTPRAGRALMTRRLMNFAESASDCARGTKKMAADTPPRCPGCGEEIHRPPLEPHLVVEDDALRYWHIRCVRRYLTALPIQPPPIEPEVARLVEEERA
jgi:hypothetical protein